MPRKRRRMRAIEITAIATLAAGWLLFLVAHAGKLAELMLAAAIPAGAWLYARARVPRLRWTLLGCALGLAAYPFGRGLFSLIFLPMPFQLLGALGLVLEALHGFPGNLAQLFFEFEVRTDTGPEAVFVAFLNGIVWAAVYGWIGRLIDHARNARAR